MQDTRCVSCCSMVKVTNATFLSWFFSCKHANGRKRQTLSLSATSKRYHQTLALMGATRLASGIFSAASSRGKGCSYYLVEFVFSPLIYPDARRVAPISGSVSSSDRPVYWVGHAGFAKQAGMACSIYEDRLSNAFIFIYFCTKCDWQESACGRFVVSKAHLLVDL